MKKNIITMTILCSVISFANTYNVIVSKENNDFKVIKGYSDVITETGWTDVGSPTCSVDHIESDFYFGETFEQTENCSQDQENTKTTTRNYSDGSSEVIKVEHLERTENTETKQNLTGIHTETSCLNVLNNGWSRGDGVYRMTDGYDVYCDQSTNGGGWTLMLNHNIHTGGVFASTSEAWNYNAANPSPNTAKYSILNVLESFRRNGKLEFRLKWDGYSHTQIWRQTSNPTNSAVSGYEPISISSTDNYWGGLEYNTGSSSYIDGSVNHGNWFYSVGSFVVWGNHNGIPASATIDSNHNGVPHVALWVR